MKQYNTGDILLLTYPFADTPDVKRRPALVILDTGDEDIIVARITSKVFKSPYDVELVEWQKAGLLFPSTVRLHKLATIEKKLVERNLGTLLSSDLTKIRSAINQIWSSVLEIKL